MFTRSVSNLRTRAMVGILLASLVPVAVLATPAKALQRVLIIDVVNVGWSGKLNNESYVSGQVTQLRDVAIPYLNSLMTGQVKFEFGKYYPGPVLLDRKLSCEFSREEISKVIAQTGISERGHYVFAFSPYNDCGYNSYSYLGDLNTTAVTWFTSTANNYGTFFRPMLWGAGLRTSGASQCLSGTNTDDGWATESCKYIPRGNPHDVTGDQESGFIDLWSPKRVAGSINNVFQRWTLGDFVDSNLYESWRASEKVTLARSDSNLGTLGIFIGGKNRYWVEYRKSPVGVNGVAIYRHGEPGKDSNSYVTFLQSTDTSPSTLFSNGLMQKNEVFVSEDKNIRIVVTDLSPESASLSITRSTAPLREILSGSIDPSSSILNSKINMQGKAGEMPVVEINILGPISMKLSRTKRYPLEPYDFSSSLPNSPVWGVVGSTTSFDVVQRSVTDASAIGAFRAIGTYADGSTVDLTSLVQDSVQLKRISDQAAAELKAKQEAEAKAAAELKAKQEAEAKAKAEAELKAKQEADAKAAASKKKTITCVKGKKVKKLTAVKPKCPKGYKKK